MDKVEAIRLFIKENLEILRSDPFQQESFKTLKFECFVGEKKIAVPKDAEIANIYVHDAIEKSQVKDEEGLNRIFSYPFFEKNISDKDRYYRLLLKNDKLNENIDYTHFKREEYKRKTIEELKAQALHEIKEQKNKEILELEAKIQAKKEEYAAIPSILDSSEYNKIPESKVDSKSEADEHFRVWYQEMGLTRNPFPEDLTDYKEILEKIVLKTSLYFRYEQLINKAPEELFRNTIFYGEFGSGKTTFFDFISLKLLSARIRPIYIQVYGEFDIYSMVFSFKRKLFEELQKIYNDEVNKRAVFTDPSSIDQQIRELLNALSTQCNIYGFIVFVDDLHRSDNLDNSLNFISQLQTTKDDLRRRLPQVRIAFYLSGSPEMESSISRNPKYSAAIQQTESLPPITVGIALETINKRLRLFSRNQNNPREVDRKFIERIIKSIELSEQPVTFRTVIRTVRDEFDQGRFTGFTADPTKILNSTLDSIRQYIEQYGEVSSQLHRFLNGPAKHLTAEQRNYCLRKIIEIYLAGSLLESDIKFSDAYYLRLLNDATLIVKTKNEGKLAWRISYSLAACNNEIIRKFNVSLEDYLIPLYGSANEKPQPSIIRKELEELDSILNSIPKDHVYEQMGFARRLHSEILDKKDEYLKDERKFGDLLSTCSASLSALTRAYAHWEKLSIHLNNGPDTVEFWKDFWYSSSALEIYFRVAYGNDDRKKRVYRAIGYYLDAFPELLNFIKRQREKAKYLHVPLHDLKNDEIRDLNECVDKWMAGDCVATVERLNHIVDKKLTSLMYDLFTILYGSQHASFLMPDDLRQTISDGVMGGIGDSDHDSFSEARRQYCEIITGNSEGQRDTYWNYVFKRVFDPWSQDEVANYLKDFGEIGRMMRYINNVDFNENEKNIILHFMKRTSDFMIKMNQAYLKLLDQNYMRRAADQVIFSFCDFKDEDIIFPIQLSDETEAKIWEVIQNKTVFKCRLDTQDYVQDGFGTDYRTFYAFLSAISNDKANPERKLIISKLEGSDIFLRVQEKTKQENSAPIKENPAFIGLKSKSLPELLMHKESTTLEFKSTFRHPIRLTNEILALEKQLSEKIGDEKTNVQQIISQKRKDLQKSLEREVVDGIAAFLNTDGGIMIVGYDEDNKRIVGLENDFASFKDRRDWDGWLQHLTNQISTVMGTNCINFIRIEPIMHESASLAKIIVNHSPVPIYSKDDDDTILCVRFLNVTRKLRGKEMVEYIRHHWKDNH